MSKEYDGMTEAQRRHLMGMFSQAPDPDKQRKYNAACRNYLSVYAHLETVAALLFEAERMLTMIGVHSFVFTEERHRLGELLTKAENDALAAMGFKAPQIEGPG